MASFMASSARFAYPLLAASMVAALAACGIDSSGPQDANVSGQYNLGTVNGHALPDTIPNSEHVFVVAAASAIFNDNGTYEASVTGTEDGSAEVEVAADNGTFTVSGNTVTLHSTVFFTTYHATVASNSDITVAVPGAFVSSSNSTIALAVSKAP